MYGNVVTETAQTEKSCSGCKSKGWWAGVMWVPFAQVMKLQRFEGVVVLPWLTGVAKLWTTRLRGTPERSNKTLKGFACAYQIITSAAYDVIRRYAAIWKRHVLCLSVVDVV